MHDPHERRVCMKIRYTISFFGVLFYCTPLLGMHQYIPASPGTDTSSNYHCSGDTLANPNRSPLSECAGPERVRHLRECGYDRKGNGLRV